MVTASIIAEMTALADETKARQLMRFFKTGKGDYGEGDKFLGLKVPQTRDIVKKYRTTIKLTDIGSLLKSEYHEIRLAGFLLLIELYNLTHKSRQIVDYYLSEINQGNNWDLVDLIAPKILGDWLIDKPEERQILHRFAEMDGHLWHQRVAIVATYPLICHGEYDDTLRIARKLLNHPHDLIHKATGWMLREVGKRGGQTQLLHFLNNHATTMPRTALRYAIERFPAPLRRHYLSLR